MPFVDGPSTDVYADVSDYPRRRCCVIVGADPSPPFTPGLYFDSPAAGGAIDGISGMGDRSSPGVPGSTSREGVPACRGKPVRVEASASFSIGASLITGSDGRVATGTGTTVLRALEASAGAGSVIWAVFV